MNISRYANIDKFVNIQYIFLLARQVYSWLFQLAQMWKLLAPGVGLVDFLTPEWWDRHKGHGSDRIPVPVWPNVRQKKNVCTNSVSRQWTLPKPNAHGTSLYVFLISLYLYQDSEPCLNWTPMGPAYICSAYTD
jgi:hypothetical protein